MVDYQAVYDSAADKVVVLSCFNPKTPLAHSCGGGGGAYWLQTVSTDYTGANFSVAAAMGGRVIFILPCLVCMDNH
jgi:hypothetical protein